MTLKAIGHRRPTEADACDEIVEVWDGVSWMRALWDSREAQSNVWWRPIDQTPPEPEKPKRRRFFTPVESLEVLPGDPPDLDAFFSLFDWMLLTYDMDDIPVETWQKLKAARHGEGGNDV